LPQEEILGMSAVTSSCNACGATYRGHVVICPNCKAAIDRGQSDLDLSPGSVIDGKYEVLSLLGVGGMGSVYKVRHLHLNALRTIKMLRKDLLTGESYRNRFVREAQLATRVQHPNVALVHDLAMLPDGKFYLVSEFIEGLTLRQWIRTYGQFPLELTLQIAMQVLSGLESICQAGLMHRDVSPDNIMIAHGIDGRPLAKIIDLGIAKATSADIPMAEATQAGLFVGNPRYSSPEQLGALRDGEVIDARVDLYSFGVVLYEMIAGTTPFVSNTPHGYAIQHLTERPAPLRERRRELAIPEALDAAILKALEKNRDKRYASAREMASALRPFSTGTLTQTTQTKLEALREGAGNDRPVHAGRNAPPVTLTPAPADAQARAAQTQAAERDLLSEVESLAQSGDISGLSQLAGLHPMGSAVGIAVRATLDRMAQEALIAQAASEDDIVDESGPPLPDMDDFSTVAVLISEAMGDAPKNDEEEVLERHRRERAAFHEAIDALQAGDPLPAGKLLESGPALHIRRRLETGLEEHHGSISWAAVASSDDPRDLRTFLEQYPNHRSAPAARDRLRQLEQRGFTPPPDRELLAWNEAMNEGSEAAWLRFIEQNPGTPRAREAVTMLAETRDYQRAISKGTELAFRVYIATWPRGRHHAEVAAAMQAVMAAARLTAPSQSLPGHTPVPPSASPRAIPLTRMEAIPGTAAEPLPELVHMPVDPLSDPHHPENPVALDARWIYGTAIAVAVALLLVLLLWWKS
jgi:serine/threonine-protein kinase